MKQDIYTSCFIAFDYWANPIQDFGSYDGPEINSHLVFTTNNNEEQGANHSAVRQLVSHRMIGPNNLTQSGLRTEQPDSDQGDVKIVGPEKSIYRFIKRSNIARQKSIKGSAEQNQIFVPHGRKAINGSANQKPPNSFPKSELNIMPGERRESMLSSIIPTILRLERRP